MDTKYEASAVPDSLHIDTKHSGGPVGGCFRAIPLFSSEPRSNFGSQPTDYPRCVQETGRKWARRYDDAPTSFDRRSIEFFALHCLVIMIEGQAAGAVNPVLGAISLVVWDNYPGMVVTGGCLAQCNHSDGIVILAPSRAGAAA